MNLKIISDEYIKSNAVGKVLNATDYDLRLTNKRPSIGGLYDYKIFGKPEVCVCGSVKKDRCPKCGVMVYSRMEYESNFAYYDAKLNFISENLLLSLLSRLSSVGLKIPTYNKNKLISIFSTEFIIEEFKKDSEIPEGSYKLVLLDKEYLLSFSELLDTSKINRCGLDGLRTLSLYMYEGNNLDFISDYIHQYLPIISPEYRQVTIKSIGGTLIKSYPPIHIEYKSFIVITKYIQDLLNKLDLSVVDIQSLKYLLSKLYNFHVNNASLVQTSKSSLVRVLVGNNRVGSSGRANIVSDPNLKINEVRLPREAVYLALQYEIINKLQNMLVDEDDSESAYTHYKNKSQIAMNALESLCDEGKALIDRNPTIHRNNILAYNIKLWDEVSIAINPLIAKSFAADFDGDQMSFYLEMDPNKLALLGDSLNAENLWIMDKDHSLTYFPSNVILYGLHVATSYNKSSSPSKTFDTFENLELGYKNNEIEVDEVVTLLPNKITTYGIEKINKILGRDISTLLNNEPINAKYMTDILMSLQFHENKLSIVNELSDFGAEVATIVGIEQLPIENIYKDLSPEIDEILKSDKTDLYKFKEIDEKLPKILDKVIKTHASSNVADLIESSRLNKFQIRSLYTPYIRLEEGKLKVGDSSLLTGLSEEELISNVLDQRYILSVKQSATPVGGYAERQLIIAMSEIKYTKENTEDDSHIFIPKSRAIEDKRDILNHIESPIDGFVAIRSTSLSNSKIVYSNQLSEKSKSLLKGGEYIGIIYSESISEFNVQSQLSLKYGAPLKEFSNDDLIAKNSGQATYDKEMNRIFVNGKEYLVSNNADISSDVLENKLVKEGDLLYIDSNLINISYRLSNWISLLGIKAVDPNFNSVKGISYAYKDGVISYTNGGVYLDSDYLGPINNNATYFYPNNTKVYYGDRLCSLILDIKGLYKNPKVRKELIPYLFSLELDRVCKKNLNINMSEVLFKVVKSSDIQTNLVNKPSDEILSRLYYGETKSAMKSLYKSGLVEDKSEIRIDNPFTKLILRLSED